MSLQLLVHVLLCVRMLVEISGLLLGAALFGLSTAAYRMDSCNSTQNGTNGSTPASAFDKDYLDAAVRTPPRLVHCTHTRHAALRHPPPTARAPQLSSTRSSRTHCTALLCVQRYSYMLPAGVSVLFYVVCTLCVVLGTREHSGMSVAHCWHLLSLAHMAHATHTRRC